MKNKFLILLFALPFCGFSQNEPLAVKQNTSKNPLIGANTKMYVSADYINLQKRAAMMGLNTAPKSRGGAAPLKVMPENKLMRGMDSIKIEGTKTSIFNQQK